MRNRIAVSGSLMVTLALMLLLLPLQWVIAMMIAALLHELGHFLAIRRFGGEIRRVSVGIGGAQIQISYLYPWQELICALAGPAAGFSLLLLLRWFPRTALCALLQSAFNLLPLYPLDGGRAVKCLENIFGLGEWLGKCLEYAAVAMLTVLGIYGTFGLRLGLFPLIVAAVMLKRAICGKIPCKQSLHWVQ